MLIGELFDILPKSKHSASYGKAEGRYPFFTSSNTVDSFVDEADYDGEYIIIGDGGTGNSKYIDGKFSVSDHNYILRPKGSTNAKAVDYFLKKDNYQILNAGFKGIGIKNVCKSYIESIDYKFCDRFSEAFIVESLDRINEGIRLAKSELESLDSLIKSRFIEMFGDPISNSKNLKTTEVINVVKLQRGFDLPVSDRNHNGDVPLYGSNGIIDHHDIDKCKKGIITGRSGTLGEVYYSNEPFWPLNTTLFSVDTRGNSIIYLKWLLTFYHLERFGSGSGVPTLNRNAFHQQQIIDVPKEEQTNFEAFVNLIDKLKFTGVSWGVAIFEVGHRKQAGI